MEKFFTFFGKLMVGIVVIAALAGGGYYLGKSGTIDLGLSTPAPEAVSTTSPDALPTQRDTMPITNPTTTSTPTKTITAGVSADSGLSFSRYTIQVADGWTDIHTSENTGTPIDTLTITKGQYEIKIFQAATGGALCLYPGDDDFMGPSSRYDTYVDITTADTFTLRRGTTNTVNGTKRGFTFCHKGPENYGQPTTFGHMTYTTPLSPDANTLKEMDGMIQTLKKVN
jgi:hypothetical protein